MDQSWIEIHLDGIPYFIPKYLATGVARWRTRKEIDRRFVQDFTLNVTSFHGANGSDRLKYSECYESRRLYVYANG